MADAHSSAPTAVAVGIDVGGTFTDLAALHTDGRIVTSKVLSVPADRAAGVLNALAESALRPTEVARIAHGTTVVTNLLLERKGARVVLCATKGFADLLELRRQERASLYDLTAHHPAALVARGDTVEVDERLVPEGVERALTPAAVSSAVSEVLARKPDMVAIALLHAYDNPVHEQMLRDALVNALRDAGRVCDVVCSHEVLPEIREYERTATTVAEAYARPVVQSYLRALSIALEQQGFCEPQVMTSAGGTLSVVLASRHAAALALSGPAGGVAGASAILRTLHIPLALTIDIGGTSADVGIIVDGEPLVERGGNVAGIPIALPRVLVEPVAAGGGSIGWIDEGGALRAGPHSAGAVPGPAAYDRGGLEATVTDAQVVLGHIPEGEWSGGVSISGERARSAMQLLSARLGVSVHRAAHALINTADATMARALRRISVERGVDPRGATLVAFGGGGPLHACGLAEQLAMTRILVPPYAGVLSAVGLALAPERREGLVSLLIPCDELSSEQLNHAITGLITSLRAADGNLLSPRSWVRARYVGQGYELEIAVTEQDTGTSIAERFGAAHEQRVGFVLDRRVECVSLRVSLVGEQWPANFARTPRDGTLAADIDDGRLMERTIVGPYTVRLPDATMHVKDRWTATALAMGGWMMEYDR
ncbi:MAG: hydantoinase/oxoprolinase family protein [Phycisphaerae bacterium]|nr:hydantoinase/oxoprolinase family protein [Gemmatimonadaceae bacterium]